MHPVGKKIIAAADSKLETFYRINPTLKGFIPVPQEILEIEQIIITRWFPFSRY